MKCSIENFKLGEADPAAAPNTEFKKLGCYRFSVVSIEGNFG